MKNRAKKIFLILILGSTFCLFLNACRHKSIDSEQLSEPEAVEYPITILADIMKTDLSDNAQLYPVNEEFLEEFLIRAQNYQGHHLQAKSSFPIEWGVVCIERLPEGKELWMVQSQSREWLYLVITSGFGTQRILDLIPVAVNIAIQDKDILETEVWTTQRESDGAFVVEKNYEWIKSVAEATKEDIEKAPDTYRRASAFTDKYYINDMGRFDYIQVTDTVPDYSAVIFYYNKNNKPEKWDEYVPMLQAFCEDRNICFEETFQNYTNIMIRDYKLNDLIEVDVTPYMGVSGAGMIMMKKGEEPKNVSFGNYERMQVEIKRYFKLLNL
ncbi:MAG: hypothetical protein RR356_00175 [Bacteroidales bacterium]